MIPARLLALLRRSAAVPAEEWPSRGVPARLDRGWRAYLIQTTSGQVGPAIQPLSGSWSIELNGTETATVLLRKADLATVEPKWVTPWWAGVLFTYTHEGTERPIIAGPITGWPSETDTDITLDFAGIRKILERRIVKREGQNTDVKLTGMSLGTIAWEVVQIGMSKPAGRLPITHGTPYETVDPGHQRTYEWWNLANNGVDKRLTELSEVIDGPDIMFRPEWVDDSHGAIRWSMVHGTETDPTIAQRFTPDWDYTAERSNVESISVKSSADPLITRLWGTGAGTGAGTVIVSANDDEFLAAGGPFLEGVFSDTDQAKASPLLAKARGQLANAGDMLDQVSMGILASDTKAPMGTWFVGDAAQVTLPDLMAVPAGSRTMRIIRASGTLTDAVSVEFQEDVFD